MRREERVSVQGPVKKQQPDGMSHRGGDPWSPNFWGGYGKGLQGPQADFLNTNASNLASNDSKVLRSVLLLFSHMGTRIVAGCAEVWACISSLARGMRRLTNGSDKWQDSFTM